MKRLSAPTTVLAAALALQLTPAAPGYADGAPAVEVDLELALLVDVSGSVDSNEYTLQRTGYVDAFRNPQIQELVAERDGIAVAYVEWSGRTQQASRGWHVLRTAEDCEEFADLIENTSRSYHSSTEMAHAIQWALEDLDTNQYVSEKQVIDVSGDGIDYNWSYYDYYGDADGSVARTRYAKSWDEIMDDLPETVAVNGISIGNSQNLQEWYHDHLPHGPKAFAMHVAAFEDFSEGIQRKLFREISDTVIAPTYD